MITTKDIRNNHADNAAAMLHYVPAPKTGRGISVTVRLYSFAAGTTRDYRIYEDRQGQLYIKRTDVRDSSVSQMDREYLTPDAAEVVRSFRAEQTRAAHTGSEARESAAPASDARPHSVTDLVCKAYSAQGATHHMVERGPRGSRYMECQYCGGTALDLYGDVVKAKREWDDAQRRASLDLKISESKARKAAHKAPIVENPIEDAPGPTDREVLLQLAHIAGQHRRATSARFFEMRRVLISHGMLPSGAAGE